MTVVSIVSCNISPVIWLQHARFFRAGIYWQHQSMATCSPLVVTHPSLKHERRDFTPMTRLLCTLEFHNQCVREKTPLKRPKLDVFAIYDFRTSPNRTLRVNVRLVMKTVACFSKSFNFTQLIGKQFRRCTVFQYIQLHARWSRTMIRVMQKVCVDIWCKYCNGTAYYRLWVMSMLKNGWVIIVKTLMKRRPRSSVQLFARKYDMMEYNSSTWCFSMFTTAECRAEWARTCRMSGQENRQCAVLF